MLSLCLCCVDEILGCIGVSMSSYDNCDHVAILNSWSLRIHYYGIVGIMLVFRMFVYDIIDLIALFKDAWFNE